MSEPISSDDQAVGAPERLHPFLLLTGIGGSLRGMAGGYAFIAYLFVSGQGTTALAVAAALLLFLFGGLLLYWSRFQYRVGANEIRIDSGIFNRTHRSIPFDRIQDVDISQGPVARLLGLARVKFETGGSAGADEGVLQAIRLDRAEQLRALVRTRRRDVAVHERDAVAEEAPVFAMELRRLLLAGVFNFSLALFAGLFGVTQTFGDILGFDPFSRTFWRSALSVGDPVREFILANRIAAAAAGGTLLVFIGLTTGIVRTVLTDYGFRLDRTGVGLRRRRGLLTRTDVTLPVKRAQAAVILTGPVRDGLGWRELKMQSLARDEGSRAHVLAPLASDDEIGKILMEVGWRPVSQDVEWRSVSPAYVWALVAGLSPLFLVAIGQMVMVPPLGAPFLALLLAAVAVRWLAWRRTAYALDRDRLLVRSGWWRRRTRILPLTKIQSIDLRENFVSRLFATASLLFGVAGGSGAYSIPAIPRADARKLRYQLLGSKP